MHISVIKDILIKKLSIQKIDISVDSGRYIILAVDDVFESMSQLERHRFIYAPLMKYILNQTIHAVSIYAFTFWEWKVRCRSNVN